MAETNEIKCLDCNGIHGKTCMCFPPKKSQYDFINPDHYKSFSLETIDMMINIYGLQKVADYCEMTAFKYRMRLGTKPDQPVERDLEKCNWYLNKAKEIREKLREEDPLP